MQELTGRLAACAVALLAFLVLGTCAGIAETSPPSAFQEVAEQQASPPSAFGNRGAPAEAPSLKSQPRVGGFIGWITEAQQKMQRRLAAAIKGLRENNPFYAGLVLAGLSFGYGVLHAAGPGHGKTIITSYVVANEETARRGILVSFLAAAVQAMTAVILVLLLAVALNASGFELKAWSGRLETASYALIALVGVWLLIRQLRTLFANGSLNAAEEQTHDHAHNHEHDHDHNHDHHGHAHHDHEHCESCRHMPDLEKLAQPLNLKQLAAVVFSVGIRPCTGAIVVLVFALAQGLLWAGIAATFAMAFGTALTVASIAILALFSRELALKLGGEGGRWGEAVWTLCGLGGSVVIILIGATLFLASLGPARPF
ncbi:MAG: nickel/cobalt transporter [Methyloligella sp. ZOD6]